MFSSDHFWTGTALSEIALSGRYILQPGLNRVTAFCRNRLPGRQHRKLKMSRSGWGWLDPVMKNTCWYTPVDNWPEEKRKAWEKRKVRHGEKVNVDSETIQCEESPAE